ncbi:MAG TPA: Gfo/Idh/MocA family oxidoreductase, partial [Isosphaeraceae bacterium]|nr:Gfo/Idh/MocA family oxidoreductase [Isosphaeraceae bacterium]
MPRHGFGIIGCGMIAEYHTKAINEIEGAEVLAAYSRSAKNGAKIAGMAGSQCRVYDDLDQMLMHPGLDVVCICTPSGAHLEPAVQAAR